MLKQLSLAVNGTLACLVLIALAIPALLVFLLRELLVLLPKLLGNDPQFLPNGVLGALLEAVKDLVILPYRVVSFAIIVVREALRALCWRIYAFVWSVAETIYLQLHARLLGKERK
jgi:hypothetical protein